MASPRSTRVRAGSVSSRSSTARGGSARSTLSSTTPLLDENASSHIALGNGFPFLVEDEDRERANESAQHIDFMIGSAELDVDGVTADGERVPVLRNLAWQL